MTKEQELVDSIVAALTATPETPVTDARGSVFPMRYKYADLSDLPMIAVYDASMESINTPNSQNEERSAMIEVMLFADGPQTPDTREDAADSKIMAIREQVEAVLGNMFDDLNVDGIAEKTYMGYRIIDDKQNKDSERLVLTCAMRYRFKYFTELAYL